MCEIHNKVDSFGSKDPQVDSQESSVRSIGQEQLQDNMQPISGLPRSRVDSSISSQHIAASQSNADLRQIGPLQVPKEAILLKPQSKTSKVGDFFAKVFTLGIYKGTRTFDQRLDTSGYTSAFKQQADGNPQEVENWLLGASAEDRKGEIKGMVQADNPKLRSWEVDRVADAIYNGMMQSAKQTRDTQLHTRLDATFTALPVGQLDANKMDNYKNAIARDARTHSEELKGVLRFLPEQEVRESIKKAIAGANSLLDRQQLDALANEAYKAVLAGVSTNEFDEAVKQKVQSLDIEQLLLQPANLINEFGTTGQNNAPVTLKLFEGQSVSQTKALVKDAIVTRHQGMDNNDADRATDFVMKGLTLGLVRHATSQHIQSLDVPQLLTDPSKTIKGFSGIGKNNADVMLSFFEGHDKDTARVLIKDNIHTLHPLMGNNDLEKAADAVMRGLTLGLARHFEEKSVQIMNANVKQFCGHTSIKQEAKLLKKQAMDVYKDKASPTKFLQSLSPGDRETVMSYLKYSALSLNSFASGNDEQTLRDLIDNAQKVKNIGEGVNGAKFLIDNKKDKVFIKPAIDGIALHGNHDGILMGLKEVTASAIDKQLGYNLVPNTMLIPIEDKALQGGNVKADLYNVSTFTAFDGCTVKHKNLFRQPDAMLNPKVKPQFGVKISTERRMQAVALDFIITSQDRHMGNLGVKTIDPSHQDLVLIDNGYSQPMQYTNTHQCSQHANVAVPATFYYVENNTQIPQDIKDHVRDKITDDFIDTLPLPQKSRDMIKWKRDALLKPSMQTMGDLRNAWIATRFDQGQGVAGSNNPGHNLGGFYDGTHI